MAISEVSVNFNTELLTRKLRRVDRLLKHFKLLTLKTRNDWTELAKRPVQMVRVTGPIHIEAGLTVVVDASGEFSTLVERMMAEISARNPFWNL